MRISLFIGGLLLSLSACSSSSGGTSSADAAAGDSAALDAAPNNGTDASADDAASVAEGGVDGAPLDGSGTQSEAGDANADCPPCAATYLCTASPSGQQQTLNGKADPDGTCHLAALTLKCGGTGTAANGGAVTWRTTAADSAVTLLTIDSGGIQLDCSPQ